jgi:glutamyl/glutaminyl-tRNA synthetase
VPILREKITTFGELSTMLTAGGELEFIHALPKYPAELLLWKKNPSREVAAKHLIKCAEVLATLADDQFTPDLIKNALWSYAEANGKGDVLWPLRAALTGKEKSPDPFTCATLLGREETLKRIQAAQMLL